MTRRKYREREAWIYAFAIYILFMGVGMLFLMAEASWLGGLR